MSIDTQSGFTYGHSVDGTNNAINFDEGSGEILAEINPSNYSLADFIDAATTAMNKVGTQLYTITVDRSTRKLTISAASAFDLLITSGAQSTISAFGLMGFTGADVIGLTTYEGDSASGSFYEPQFILQNFIDFADDVKAANSKVNQSASGRNVEVVKYGTIRMMTCDIKFITDIVPQGVITANPTGVSDAREFMLYATTKGNMEFIEDKTVPTTFTKCLLESTPTDSAGTGFVLKELYSRGLSGYFELKRLKFREIIG